MTLRADCAVSVCLPLSLWKLLPTDYYQWGELACGQEFTLLMPPQFPASKIKQNFPLTSFAPWLAFEQRMAGPHFQWHFHLDSALSPQVSKMTLARFHKGFKCSFLCHCVPRFGVNTAWVAWEQPQMAVGRAPSVGRGRMCGRWMLADNHCASASPSCICVAE